MKKYINNIRKEYREIKESHKKHDWNLNFTWEEMLKRERGDADAVLKNRIWNKNLCLENNFFDRPTKEEYKDMFKIDMEIAEIAEFINDYDNNKILLIEDLETEFEDLHDELRHLFIYWGGELIDEDEFMEREQEILEHLELVTEELEKELDTLDAEHAQGLIEGHDYTKLKYGKTELLEGMLEVLKEAKGE